MKTIPLSNGGEAIVDDENYEWVARYKWRREDNKLTSYAVRQVRDHGKRHLVKIHHYIVDVPTGLVIDHMDGNGLNNRKSNLRVCSIGQNNMNRRPNKNSTSKYKGVHWNSKDKVWKAAIQYKERYIYLGRFKVERDAAVAYDNSARELFGEYAYLNFP